jgi:hypothetical protein
LRPRKRDREETPPDVLFDDGADAAGREPGVATEAAAIASAATAVGPVTGRGPGGSG